MAYTLPAVFSGSGSSGGSQGNAAVQVIGGTARIGSVVSKPAVQQITFVAQTPVISQALYQLPAVFTTGIPGISKIVNDTSVKIQEQLKSPTISMVIPDDIKKSWGEVYNSKVMAVNAPKNVSIEPSNQLKAAIQQAALQIPAKEYSLAKPSTQTLELYIPDDVKDRWKTVINNVQQIGTSYAIKAQTVEDLNAIYKLTDAGIKYLTDIYPLMKPVMITAPSTTKLKLIGQEELLKSIEQKKEDMALKGTYIKDDKLKNAKLVIPDESAEKWKGASNVITKSALEEQQRAQKLNQLYDALIPNRTSTGNGGLVFNKLLSDSIDSATAEVNWMKGNTDLNSVLKTIDKAAQEQLIKMDLLTNGGNLVSYGKAVEELETGEKRTDLYAVARNYYNADPTVIQKMFTNEKNGTMPPLQEITTIQTKFDPSKAENVRQQERENDTNFLSENMMEQALRRTLIIGDDTKSTMYLASRGYSGVEALSENEKKNIVSYEKHMKSLANENELLEAKRQIDTALANNEVKSIKIADGIEFNTGGSVTVYGNTIELPNKEYSATEIKSYTRPLQDYATGNGNGILKSLAGAVVNVFANDDIQMSNAGYLRTVVIEGDWDKTEWSLFKSLGTLIKGGQALQSNVLYGTEMPSMDALYTGEIKTEQLTTEGRKAIETWGNNWAETGKTNNDALLSDISAKKYVLEHADVETLVNVIVNQPRDIAKLTFNPITKSLVEHAIGEDLANQIRNENPLTVEEIEEVNGNLIYQGLAVLTDANITGTPLDVIIAVAGGGIVANEFEWAAKGVGQLSKIGRFGDDLADIVQYSKTAKVLATDTLETTGKLLALPSIKNAAIVMPSPGSVAKGVSGDSVDIKKMISPASPLENKVVATKVNEYTKAVKNAFDDATTTGNSQKLLINKIANGNENEVKAVLVETFATDPTDFLKAISKSAIKSEPEVTAKAFERIEGAAQTYAKMSDDFATDLVRSSQKNGEFDPNIAAKYLDNAANTIGELPVQRMLDMATETGIQGSRVVPSQYIDEITQARSTRDAQKLEESSDVSKQLTDNIKPASKVKPSYEYDVNQVMSDAMLERIQKSGIEFGDINDIAKLTDDEIATIAKIDAKRTQQINDVIKDTNYLLTAPKETRKLLNEAGIRSEKQLLKMSDNDIDAIASKAAKNVKEKDKIKGDILTAKQNNLRLSRSRIRDELSVDDLKNYRTKANDILAKDELSHASDEITQTTKSDEAGETSWSLAEKEAKMGKEYDKLYSLDNISPGRTSARRDMEEIKAAAKKAGKEINTMEDLAKTTDSELDAIRKADPSLTKNKLNEYRNEANKRMSALDEEKQVFSDTSNYKKISDFRKKNADELMDSTEEYRKLVRKTKPTEQDIERMRTLEHDIEINRKRMQTSKDILTMERRKLETTIRKQTVSTKPGAANKDVAVKNSLDELRKGNNKEALEKLIQSRNHDKTRVFSGKRLDNYKDVSIARINQMEKSVPAGNLTDGIKDMIKQMRRERSEYALKALSEKGDDFKKMAFKASNGDELTETERLKLWNSGDETRTLAKDALDTDNVNLLIKGLKDDAIKSGDEIRIKKLSDDMKKELDNCIKKGECGSSAGIAKAAATLAAMTAAGLSTASGEEWLYDENTNSYYRGEKITGGNHQETIPAAIANAITELIHTSDLYDLTANVKPYVFDETLTAAERRKRAYGILDTDPTPSPEHICTDYAIEIANALRRFGYDANVLLIRNDNTDENDHAIVAVREKGDVTYKVDPLSRIYVGETIDLNETEETELRKQIFNNFVNPNYWEKIDGMKPADQSVIDEIKKKTTPPSTIQIKEALELEPQTGETYGALRWDSDIKGSSVGIGTITGFEMVGQGNEREVFTPIDVANAGGGDSLENAVIADKMPEIIETGNVEVKSIKDLDWSGSIRTKLAIDKTKQQTGGE